MPIFSSDNQEANHPISPFVIPAQARIHSPLDSGLSPVPGDSPAGGECLESLRPYFYGIFYKSDFRYISQISRSTYYAIIPVIRGQGKLPHFQFPIRDTIRRLRRSATNLFLIGEGEGQGTVPRITELSKGKNVSGDSPS